MCRCGKTVFSPAASGEVLTCGDNRYGQLGYHKATPPPTTNSTQTERLPQVVASLQGKAVTRLECGDFFCIASCKGGLRERVCSTELKFFQPVMHLNAYMCIMVEFGLLIFTVDV